MPLHPQAVSLLALMEQVGGPPIVGSGPEEIRASRRARIKPSTIELHEIRAVDAGGVPSRLYRPTERTDGGLLVFFHGGGWVIGDLDSHDDVCRTLAARSGHAVLSVDYRLAPEHPFPAGLEDATTALRWAHANADALGCRADLIAVGGDSAGGNLAAVVAQLAPVPLVFQLLVYPVTDCTMSQPSYVDNGSGYFLGADEMEWFIDHYLGSSRAARSDPRASPLLASDTALAGGPPALVITAEFDPLRDEGDAYAARLAQVGVPTSHVRFGGMFHGFFSLADYLDDGRTSNALAAAALATVFARATA